MIQLVNAPLAACFRPGIRAGAYPPLHLAALAAYLRQQHAENDIEILDGEVIPWDTLLDRVGVGELVGISCNSLTYERALQIAEAAKSKGAQVVLGGAHPTAKGSEILRNRLFVDALVVGDGEPALLGLALRHAPAAVPNLMYRRGNQIHASEHRQTCLDELPCPDYSGIALEPYFSRNRELYSERPFTRSFSMYSAKGCAWRSQSQGGCVFCSIPHSGIRMKSPLQFWRDVLDLSNKWRADFIWDVSDSFTTVKSWLREVMRFKPPGLRLRFHIYARSADIDKETADLLSDLGVYEVLIGVESGSEALLRKAHKGATPAQNLNAIRRLNAVGIRVAVSIVLGLPGESRATLSTTHAFVSDLLTAVPWDGSVSEINCSILLPLPGSRAFELIEQHLPIKPGEEDYFNPDLVREIWTRQRCSATYADILGAQSSIHGLHLRGNFFGMTQSEEAAISEKTLDLHKSPVHS